MKVDEKRWSRRNFLSLMGKCALGAAIGTGWLNSKALAATAELPWVAWPKLDPSEIAELAYWGYYGEYDGKGCAYGVFNAIVTKLNEQASSPIPEEMLTYGKGGMMGFGHLCGALNGGGAVINLVAGLTPIKENLGNLSALIQELMLWYAQAEHPLYKPPSPKLDVDILSIVPGSALCHVFVSKWCKATGYGAHDPERHECCARLVGGVASKTAELLNKYFAGEFTPEYEVPESVKVCLSCHGEEGLDDAKAKMDCLLCHKGHRWHGAKR